MTRKDKYAQKHPSDRKINQDLADTVKGRATNEEIPCAVAFDIVSDLKVPPIEVGFTIDALEIKVVKCQLGLFGYRPQKMKVKPADNVSSTLEETIRKELVNNKLPCKAAWEIAEKSGLRKMEVSSACEALKIKISSCQLGTFR
ncbi:MAG: hypothetical protein PVG99_01925 [Desulfobacteraceae bacterium]|jgi:hypothetical protein